jgi:hypothetical protein
VIAELFANVPAQARRRTPPRFVDRPLQEQQAFVMFTRYILEEVRRVISEQVGEHERQAIVELTALTQALHRRFPTRVARALRRSESVVDVVLELLGDSASGRRPSLVTAN